VHHGGEQFLAFPTFMIIEASSRCNLLCPLCLWTHNRNHGQLSVDTFSRFLDTRSRTLKRVCFSGRGEPTLNPQLYDLLQLSVQAGLITDLATNGTTLLRDRDKIFESGVDWVNVSIEADNRSDYQRYRIRGDFDEVVSGMEQLAAEKRRRGLTKPGLRTCSVIFNYNERRLSELKNFYNSLGFESFIFKSAHLGHGQLREDEESLRDKWLPRDPTKVRPRYRGDVIGVCSFLKKAHLLWNGDIARCAIDHDTMIVGNIHRASFPEIWKGERSREVVRRILDGRFHKCGSCAFSGREVSETDTDVMVI
jgi:MoaA/NifB/PqqE/SkfB family radical SAM enzyme